MKQGQAEMIGLLLIVIILAIGFLFYVRFSFSGDLTSYQADFAQAKLAQSYVTSLAKTELSCGGQVYTVDELVKEIAQGTTSCQAETELEELINDTLTKTHNLFGTNYRLVIVKKTSGGEETIGLKNFTNSEYSAAEQCNVQRKMVHESYLYLVAMYGSSVYMRLEQC